MAAWLPSPAVIAHLVLIFIIFQMLVLSAAFMVWMERKVCAYIQDRLGPNRVGYAGWLQPFADVIKLITKEELRPKAADTILFTIAPVLSAAAAFAAFSVVPFGTFDHTLSDCSDEPLPLQVTDVNVGVLVLFAIASMGVYGIVLAGWSSNSKWTRLLGGLRSSAQMISYELSYALALAAVIMLAGSGCRCARLRRRNPATGGASSPSGTPSSSRSGSSSTCARALPRPTARRLTFPKRNRSSSPATTPSTLDELRAHGHRRRPGRP